MEFFIEHWIEWDQGTHYPTTFGWKDVLGERRRIGGGECQGCRWGQVGKYYRMDSGEKDGNAWMRSPLKVAWGWLTPVFVNLLTFSLLLIPMWDQTLCM